MHPTYTYAYIDISDAYMIYTFLFVCVYLDMIVCISICK